MPTHPRTALALRAALLLAGLLISPAARAGRLPRHLCPAFAAVEQHTSGAYFTGDTQAPWDAIPLLITPAGNVVPRSMERGEGGVLHLRGFLPVVVPPTTGAPACPAALTPGEPAKLEATVDTSQLPPDAEVWVTGCGGSAHEVRGRVEMSVQAGACALVVYAYDGKFRWASDPVEVHPVAGEVLHLQLTSGQVQHWAGLVLLPSPGGYVITRFPAGSRAVDSGLAVGDEVTHIAGVAVRGLAPAAVQALLTGPEGTTVEVTVAGGRRHEVRRAPRDASFNAGNVGLRVEAVGGRIVVAEVVGPAAKRGLRPGDVILASGGKTADEWTVGHLTLHWRGGGLRRVQFQRGDDVHTVILPVRRLR